MGTRKQLLQRARNAKRESGNLDFKREFDPNSTAHWCELIKDIIAFSNSGGGVIVFGANDDGSIADFDTARVLSVDEADVTNKIAKYTSVQFSGFEFVEIVRDGHTRAALLVYRSDVPLVFTKPGTYEAAGGRQKTAFAKGTLYFRHGSKSEPGTHDDLVRWRDREIERIRRSWLGNIRKVIEAPLNYRVQMVSPTDPTNTSVLTAKITGDSSAVPVRPHNANEIWPYRQKELVKAVNDMLDKSACVNSYDILCIRKKYDITPETRPEFAFRSHPKASTQYSRQFAEWIVREYNKNKSFFVEARRYYRKSIAT